MSGGEKTLVIKNEKNKKLLSNVRHFDTWDEICVTKILLEILQIGFY